MCQIKARVLLVILWFSITGGMGSAWAEVPAARTVPPQSADESVPGSSATAAKNKPCLLKNQGLQSFPQTFTSEIPHDAYDASSDLGKDLEKAKREGCPADKLKVQRMYDLFSWKSFLALNWPVSPVMTMGKVDLAQNFTDKGVPQWTTWMDAGEVFKDDGSPPANPDTWDSRPPRTTRVLSTTDQPFSVPLWDQNGSPVYYEMLLNKFEFQYIFNNSLYNQEGQTEYLNNNKIVVFSPGTVITKERKDGAIGPIELKLAWKILGPDDIRERYFRMQARIPADTGGMKDVDVGLVGMHIGHKTASSFSWIWSTFEHVDNLRVSDQEVLEGKPLKPSFYNPYCPTCPVNEPPVSAPPAILRTQVKRVIPISELTAALNHEAQQRLRNMNSEWQYYELVGTQYATGTVMDTPTPEFQGAKSIVNHSGGSPTPAYLVNAVMETYQQKGNQESPLVSPNGNVRVFQTSSCSGCHFDAGLLQMADGKAKSIPGTADFSWLFGEAKSKTSRTQVTGERCVLSN